VLKGKLSGSVALYGDGDFICARCHFQVGRYLVFLRRDGKLLTGSNWHLSIRKITGGSEKKVEWFDDKQIFENQELLLSDVQNEIKAVLVRPKHHKAKI